MIYPGGRLRKRRGVVRAAGSSGLTMRSRLKCANFRGLLAFLDIHLEVLSTGLCYGLLAASTEGAKKQRTVAALVYLVGPHNVLRFCIDDHDACFEPSRRARGCARCPTRIVPACARAINESSPFSVGRDNEILRRIFVERQNDGHLLFANSRCEVGLKSTHWGDHNPRAGVNRRCPGSGALFRWLRRF